MSLVHLHLLLNHVPVIGSVFAVLLISLAIRMRSNDVTRAGLVSLLVVGTIAAVVFFTGEPAEDAVENLAGVSNALISQHEEAAQVAFIAAGPVGALALVVLLFTRRREMPRWVAGAALAASLIVVGLMGWTANLGGQIRHTEIRTASAASAGQGGEAAAPGERGERERGGR